MAALLDCRPSANSQQLAAAAGEPGLFGEAALWNLRDGHRISTFLTPGDSFYDVTFDHSSRQLVTCGYDQKIRVWDISKQSVVHTLPGHNGAVFALATQGNLLASASADRTVKLWNLATAERMDTFGESLKDIYTVAMHPRGSHVAAAGVDNRIRVWELSASGKEGTNRLQFARFAHQGSVIALAWSPDGKQIASSAEDRTLKLWDAATLTERHALPLQPDWAAALAFSPDGKRLAVGRLDGTLAFYDTESAQPIAPAKPELSGVTPPGFQFGTTTVARLTGKHLLGIEQVICSEPQVAVSLVSLEQVSKEDQQRILAYRSSKFGQPALEAWVKITVPVGLSTDRAMLSVRTAAGQSSTVPVYFDSLPQIAETLSDSIEDAVPAKLESSVWGTIEKAGETDRYQFSAKAGQTVVVDLAAARVASKLNAVAVLYDGEGRLIDTSNDFDGEADPLITVQVPADGNYTLRITDLMATGSASHNYRLSIGTFPYVTGCFPSAVPLDKASQVELTGFNIPAGTMATVHPKALGKLALAIDPQKFRIREAIEVQVVPEADTAEREPNDTVAAAMPIKIPVTVAGRILATDDNSNTGRGDVDLFRFSAQQGESWILETVAAVDGSPLDTKLEVLDLQGQPIERVILEATRDSYINFRPIDSQTVDVRVQNWEEMETQSVPLHARGGVQVVPHAAGAGLRVQLLRRRTEAALLFRHKRQCPRLARDGVHCRAASPWYPAALNRPAGLQTVLRERRRRASQTGGRFYPVVHGTPVRRLPCQSDRRARPDG